MGGGVWPGRMVAASRQRKVRRDFIKVGTRGRAAVGGDGKLAVQRETLNAQVAAGLKAGPGL